VYACCAVERSPACSAVPLVEQLTDLTGSAAMMMMV
jgi:hypothetical protein